MDVLKKEALFESFMIESKRINEALKIGDLELLESRLSKREALLDQLKASPCQEMTPRLYEIKGQLEVLEGDNIQKMEDLMDVFEKNFKSLKDEKEQIKNIKRIKNNYFLGKVAKETSTFDLRS